jgi:hypothetical protein
MVWTGRTMCSNIKIQFNDIYPKSDVQDFNPAPRLSPPSIGAMPKFLSNNVLMRCSFYFVMNPR